MKDTYSLMINRSIDEVLSLFDYLDPNRLPSEGGYSFEGIRGGTRIRYTTNEGPRGFFQIAELLLAQITRRDRGLNVPELVFEP